MYNKSLFHSLPYSITTYNNAMQFMLSAAENRLHEYIFTPNVHHFYLFSTNPEFRKAYNDAYLSLLDGMPLVFAIRCLSDDFSLEKISGSDFTKDLVANGLKNGMKILMLGGNKDVGYAALKALRLESFYGSKFIQLYPIVDINKDQSMLVKEINKFSPDIFLVALGAPKAELFIYRWFPQIDCGIAASIGASFDFIAGIKKRAPLIMQKLGFEWLFRLITDPKRLFKRYLITNSFFLPFLLHSLVSAIVKSITKKLLKKVE
jgi:N-acetylglucosaminyldiphosphoundecaprenol N-acetyl-beta-D-mannosaminyltransferase